MLKKLIGIATLSSLFFTTTVMAAEKQHVVKKGDTLSEICQVHMEDGTRKTYIREAKRLGIINPDKIYVGQIFTFPKIHRVSWTLKVTGYSSHGSWSTDKKSISDIVRIANSRFALISHTVETK